MENSAGVIPDIDAPINQVETRAGIRSRRAVYALLLAQVVFLLFWRGEGRAPVSNVLQFLIAAGAGAVCLSLARTGGVLRRFWLIVAAGVILWDVAEAVSIFYENVLRASTTAWWPSDLLFFVAPAPLLLTLFDGSEEQKRISVIDVLQLTTVAVGVYACFIFAPWRAMGDSVGFGLLEWKVFLIRDAVMFVTLSVRLLRRREWFSRGAVSAFLLSAGVGQGIYLYYQAQGVLHSGTMADLVWSLPFVFLAMLARPRLSEDSDAPGLRGALFYGALALYGIFLTAMLFSVAGFSGAQLRVAQVTLLLAFFLFALRLIGVHRALAAKMTDVQSLNHGLESRVAERTRQLQKANTALLLQNAEVTRLAQIKSRFMANVSHEFRTPLNAMIGFSSLLLAEDMSHLPRNRKYVEHIQESAMDLSGLVHDVLDYSDMDSGNIILSPVIINLKAFSGELIAGLGSALHDKQLVLECLMPDMTVAADRSRLRQIMTNLLKTAMRFTSANGTIKLTGVEMPGCAEITISHAGRELAPERLEEAFTEFSQLGPDRNDEFAGAGLSLAIARRLVELHGGTIHIESSPGNGRSFIFTIPTVQTH